MTPSHKQLLRAAKVITLDPQIWFWLKWNDPKALAQLQIAIQNSEKEN